MTNPRCERCGGSHSPERTCLAKVERFFEDKAAQKADRAMADAREGTAIARWNASHPKQ